MTATSASREAQVTPVIPDRGRYTGAPVLGDVVCRSRSYRRLVVAQRWQLAVTVLVLLVPPVVAPLLPGRIVVAALAVTPLLLIEAALVVIGWHVTSDLLRTLSTMTTRPGDDRQGGDTW